jgi:hypothetical protein
MQQFQFIDETRIYALIMKSIKIYFQKICSDNNPISVRLHIDDITTLKTKQQWINNKIITAAELKLWNKQFQNNVSAFKMIKEMFEYYFRT